MCVFLCLKFSELSFLLFVNNEILFIDVMQQQKLEVDLRIKKGD